MCSSVITNKVVLIVFLDNLRLVFCEFTVLRYSVLYYSVLYCVITVLRRLFNGACEDSSADDAIK